MLPETQAHPPFARSPAPRRAARPVRALSLPPPPSSLSLCNPGLASSSRLVGCLVVWADLLGISGFDHNNAHTAYYAQQPQSHLPQQPSLLQHSVPAAHNPATMLITPPVSPPDSMAHSSTSGSDDEQQMHAHEPTSALPTVDYPPTSSALPPLNFNFGNAAVPSGMPMPYRDAHAHPGDATSTISKRRKKTAHNAIERKYRNSINDRISELKDALPPHITRDTKTKSKATILQKCLDYVRHLEKTNAVLRGENETLKQRLASLAGEGGAAGMNGAPAQSDASARLSSEQGRALMCVLFCGFFVFGGMANPAQQHQGAGHQGGARTLAEAPEDEALVAWLLAAVIPWVCRAAAFALCAVVMFAQDRVTDPSGAEEHEQKCAVALVNGSVGKAKHHALKSLALLGQPHPSTEGDVLLSSAASFTRQLLHRCVLGEVVDSYLAQRSTAVAKAHVTAANVNHMLHQLLSMENTDVPSANRQKCLAMVRSLNAAEAVKSEMDPVALMRIYVAAAIEVQLSLHSDVAAVLAGHYLEQARACFHSCAEDSASLAWMFKPEGDEFVRSRKWCAMAVVGLDGEKLRPGVLGQLGMAYRVDLLARGLREFISGADAERANDIFCDLRQYSIQCGDYKNEWWAAVGVVLLSWRQGKNVFARQVFCEVDQMSCPKTKLQEFVYAACRSHQALLDGDHGLCWRAMRLAASLVEQLDSEEDSDHVDNQTDITNLGRTIAFQHLLATRVALIRVRSYLEQVSSTDSAGQAEIIGSDGKAVSRAGMRNALNADVASLRRFSDTFPLAKPSAHLYQAIYRSLAGGRVSITEHMFHESLKSARRLKQPYDEAAAMLHASIYMRPTLTVSAIKTNLTQAVSIFQRLEAMDELCTARKLLHVLV